MNAPRADIGVTLAQYAPLGSCAGELFASLYRRIPHRGAAPLQAVVLVAPALGSHLSSPVRAPGTGRSSATLRLHHTSCISVDYLVSLQSEGRPNLVAYRARGSRVD